MASSVAASNTRVAEKVLPLSSAANPFASASPVMASTGVSDSKIAERAEQQGSGVAAEIVAGETNKRIWKNKGKKSCEAEAEAGKEIMEEGKEEGGDENDKKRVKATATIAIALEDNNNFKFKLPSATQFTFGTNDEVIAAAEEMEYIKPPKPALYFGTQPAKPFEPFYTFELPKMKIKEWKKDFKLAAYESQTTTDFWKKPEAHLPNLERALVRLEDNDEVVTTTEVDEDDDEWENEAKAMATATVLTSQRICAGIIHNSAQLKLTQDYIRDIEAVHSSLATEAKTSMSVIVRDVGGVNSCLDEIAEMVVIKDLAVEIGKLHMDIMDSMKDMRYEFSSLSQEIKEIGAEVIDTLASLPEDLAAKHDEWEDESDSLTQVLFPQGNGRWDFDGVIVQAGRGGGGGGGWCNLM